MQTAMTLLAIYAMSTVTSVFWVWLAHNHKRGIHRYFSFEHEHYLIQWCYIPIVNTIFSVISWVFIFPISKKD